MSSWGRGVKTFSPAHDAITSGQPKLVRCRAAPMPCRSSTLGQGHGSPRLGGLWRCVHRKANKKFHCICEKPLTDALPMVGFQLQEHQALNVTILCSLAGPMFIGWPPRIVVATNEGLPVAEGVAPQVSSHLPFQRKSSPHGSHGECLHRRRPHR
jgi:hypothetical protein